MQSSRVGSKWVLVVKRSHQERVYGGHKNRTKETKGTRQTSGRTWCRLSYLVNHCTLADFPVDDTCSLLFSQLGLLHLHGNGLRLCLISEQDPFYQIFNSKCDIWHFVLWQISTHSEAGFKQGKTSTPAGCSGCPGQKTVGGWALNLAALSQAKASPPAGPTGTGEQKGGGQGGLGQLSSNEGHLSWGSN